MKIEEVEGIGPAYVAKLNAARVRTTNELLAAAASPWAAMGSPRRPGLAAG